MAKIFDDRIHGLEALLSSDPVALGRAPEILGALPAEAPVHRAGAVVLVSGYEDVKSLVRDETRLSKQFVLSGTRVDAVKARLDNEQLRAYDEVARFESMAVSRSDGEQHARLRGIAHRAFTPRRIAALGSSIRRYARDLIAGVEAGEKIDLVSRLAYPLPLMVICDLLGVPAEDREQIHAWSKDLGRNRGGDDPAALMTAYRAMLAFRRYVEQDLVPRRRDAPGTDLLSALLDAEQEERLSDEELTSMFVVLLFAGHETTTNLIATGLFELLRHPDQWQRLRTDPDLAASATEELLRWVTPVQWLPRVAVRDQVIGDVEVAVGQTVFLVLAAANRDGSVFTDPGRLDIGRADARKHLALGHGPHFCLGNALARLEGTLVLEHLAREHPRIALADEPGWRGHAQLRALNRLDVVLDPA